MASNTFGELLRMTTFGESHGPAIGVVVDGVPAGLPITPEMIQHDLDRRRPGQSNLTTPRNESDSVEILSGVFEGTTTGHPLAMLIRNSDAVSTAYDDVKDLFRPGHADRTWLDKYGIRDHRGSGRASGRETACRVAAGALARSIIARAGMRVMAGAVQIGGVRASTFDPQAVWASNARSADPAAAPAMEAAILEAAARKDSIGGIVECHAEGVLAGLGAPMYRKLDAMLAAAIFGLGAVKGLEFGAGFAAAGMRGSEHNDGMTPDGYLTNNAGGIVGGVSTGQTIVFRAAIKPTPSIASPQTSIDTSGNPVTCIVEGRHDPCIIPRIVPVIEAMTAFVLADMLLLARGDRLSPKKEFL